MVAYNLQVVEEVTSYFKYKCFKDYFCGMKLSRYINIICIIIGGAVAIYANAAEQQNTYVLVGGIVLLMFGIYRTSRNVPSKFDNPQEETFVKTEYIEEDED